jgi:hypothetical protein
MYKWHHPWLAATGFEKGLCRIGAGRNAEAGAIQSVKNNKLAVLID